MKHLSLLRVFSVVSSLLIFFISTCLYAKSDAHVTIQWLGRAAFKITSVTGKVILIDPLYY